MGWWSQSKAAVQSAFRLEGGLPNTKEPFASEYRLDSSTVDVTLARALYRNNEPRYKLGAGFSRAAINVPVGFIGSPILTAAKDADDRADANDWLARLMPQWTGATLDTHLAVLRDGDALVRLRAANRSPAYSALFTPDDKDLELSFEQSESFEIIHMDEDMGAIEKIRVKHAFYVEEGGQTVERFLWETVTPTEIILTYENNLKPERRFPNTLGFVPAVHMQNESHRHELRGRSELEAIEPYMKFYHDVMLHAGAASKLHSTAKLVLRVQDVDTFLTNNFSDAEIADRRLRFKDKDVLFFETGAPEIGVTGASAYQEGADIIQAEAPLGDTNTLLEYIFLNIVDVSEIPEWAFGGAIASSKASVSEQSAPLVHKVNRKRSLFENDWALVGRMALKMLGISARVEVGWDDLNQRDTKAEAETIKLLAEAFIALNDVGMVSKITAVEELRPYLKKLLPYLLVDNSREEKARLTDEFEEKAQAVLDQTSEEEEDLDDQDREAGLRVIG